MRRHSIHSSKVSYLNPHLEGIIVGSDANQEWLLPWWWERYSKHNTYPVAFFDFGMSEEGLAWCAERGRICELTSRIFPLKPLSETLKQCICDPNPSNTAAIRSAWFKKTLAFLQSPFPFTCWIDLDCEIRGHLGPLFRTLDGGADIGIVQELEGVEKKSRRAGLLFPDEKSYNTGVVVFRQSAGILEKSAELALKDNDQFLSDQEALSRTIYLYRPQIVEMSPLFNWNITQGTHPDALILHYVSTWKSAILLQLDVKNNSISN